MQIIGNWQRAFGRTPNRPSPAGAGDEKLWGHHFVSGQPLSFGVKNALSPGTTASCL